MSELKQWEIVKAHDDGNVVEMAQRPLSNTALCGWHPIDKHHKFNFEENYYRVKETPKTVTIEHWLCSDGEIHICKAGTDISKSFHNGMRNSDWSLLTIQVIEVEG